MSEQEKQGEFISHLLDGNSAMIRDDYDGAIKAFGLALKANPKFFLAAAKLGDAFLKRGDPSKAVKYLTYSLELNPEQPRILFKLGQAYESLGMAVQAKVAYEMAKEIGNEKEFIKTTSDSGKRRRRAQKSTSGRALAQVSPADIIKGTVTTFFRYPLILIPFIMSAAALSAVEVWLDAAFHKVTGHIAARTSIAEVILTGHLEYNMEILVHYIFLGFCISILCAPLLSSAPVIVSDIYHDRKPSLTKALSRSFRQISPIAAFSMIFFMIVAGADAVAGVLVMSVNQMLIEMAGLKFNFFWMSSLAIPYAASYFIYTAHSIVIEKQQMEKGFEKGLRVGKRFVGLTFVILMIYTMAHLLIAHLVLANYETVGFIKTRYLVLMAITPFQAAASIAVTLVFLRAQHVKRKKRAPLKNGVRPASENGDSDDDDEGDEDFDEN